MTQVPQSDDKAELLTEALAALRELTRRSEDAFDQVADEDYWQSDEFSDAVKRAKTVLARADAATT
ncbi:hypothetical protein [Caulobacter sp. X]|uniref:hypothetical protein n=1 Tax=Caulobacter sp. X TaxID=2048901 RepID=UPI000C14F462|nr:hypothetical protein [Caulobacter sp. X]PIB96942.1 hypothetical protein CSW60_20890 [Caulobacter sp. X]